MKKFNGMKKRIVSTILGFVIQCLCIVSLSACDFKKEDINILRDRSEDYKSTQTYPTLAVPQGIHAEPCTDVYEIP